MADNAGRPFPKEWDFDKPLAMYTLEGDQMCPYREHASNHRVEEVWASEGLDGGFDNASDMDLTKGHFVVLPTVSRDRRGRDLRSQEDVSRSFGKGLLEFERAALSVKSLFASYADAYETNKSAAERLDAGGVAVQSLFDASKRRMEIAKQRYSEALDVALRYCDWAYSRNNECMVGITLRNDAGRTLEDYPVRDVREHEEIAHTLTFGSDAEVSELLRSVELCSMWCDGNTILDVTRGAALIAKTWPERSSYAADLICDAVQRDVARLVPVVRMAGCDQRSLRGHWNEVGDFTKDVSDWANDCLLALDCAWLMDPTMMPPAPLADSLASTHAMMSKIDDVVASSGREFSDGAMREVLSRFKWVADDLSEHLGPFGKIYPNKREMRERVGNLLVFPRGRLALLARSVSTGRSAETWYGKDGLMTMADRCAMNSDPEAAMKAYEQRVRFYGKYDAADVSRYHDKVFAMTGNESVGNRSAIDVDVSGGRGESGVGFDGPR